MTIANDASQTAAFLNKRTLWLVIAGFTLFYISLGAVVPARVWLGIVSKLVLQLLAQLICLFLSYV